MAHAYHFLERVRQMDALNGKYQKLQHSYRQVIEQHGKQQWTPVLPKPKKNWPPKRLRQKKPPPRLLRSKPTGQAGAGTGQNGQLIVAYGHSARWGRAPPGRPIFYPNRSCQVAEQAIVLMTFMIAKQVSVTRLRHLYAP